MTTASKLSGTESPPTSSPSSTSLIHDSNVAVQMVGCSYRELDHWARAGYLFPEGGKGSGHRRAWPLDELYIARQMVVLVNSGILPAAAAVIARSAQPGESAAFPNLARSHVAYLNRDTGVYFEWEPASFRTGDEHGVSVPGRQPEASVADERSPE